MALQIQLEHRNCPLSEGEEARIRHHLEALGRRLVHFPGPIATLVLNKHGEQRSVAVSLRVELGPLGPHLVSHEAAETPDRATRLAVEDVEDQLEEHLAKQRGEPSFGVPSRRLPKALRPHPPEAAGEPTGGGSAEAERGDEVAQGGTPPRPDRPATGGGS